MFRLVLEPTLQTERPTMLFSELGLPEPIVRAATDAGYTDATQIQADAIPILLAGHDLVGCSQTGTGKTAAFAMPLLSKVDLNNKAPQVLVMTPTRELAIQVAEAFEQYGAGLKNLRVLAVYGGAAYQPQLSALRRGVQVIVGTPGRLIDHIKSSAIKLDDIHSLVLDEADEMLRMGFIDDVKWVLSQAPENRQIALFSATMPGPIRDIAEKHLKDPKSITVDRAQKSAQTIRQQHIVVSPKHKVEVLCRLLEVESTDGVIVFVKTKLGTVELADRLVARGFNAAPLNGDIAQTQRQRTVEKLKSGEINILVATDVAARGLDVDRISHVINYDLPHDQEAYVHRIGRTGRAGREGAAILLVTPAQRHAVRSIQRMTGTTIEMIEQPSIEMINQHRSSMFKERITKALESRQLATLASLVEEYCTETGQTPTQVAAAIAVMSVNDRRFFARPLDEPTLAPPRENRRDSNDFARRDSDNRGDRPQRDFAKREAFRNEQGRDDSKRPGFNKGDFAGKKSRPGDSAMERYRLEVGRVHGVQPGNLVGAIANEAGLGGAEIGKIDIFDHFSIVALPAGMPESVFNALSQTWVSGRQLRLSRDSHPANRGGAGKPTFRKSAPAGERPFQGKPLKKKKFKKAASSE